MTNEELIAEIEALDQAATPGPWLVFPFSSEVEPRMMHVGPGGHSVAWIINVDSPVANATLIARYRTLAVEAARALKELEEDDNVRRFINAAKNYDKNDELARAMAWILQTAGDAASGDPAAAAILADAATAIVKDFEEKR